MSTGIRISFREKTQVLKSTCDTSWWNTITTTCLSGLGFNKLSSPEDVAMTAHQSPGQVRNLDKKPCRDPLNGHQSTCIRFFICKLIFQHLICHSVHYHGNFTKEFLLPSKWWRMTKLACPIMWSIYTLIHSHPTALIVLATHAILSASLEFDN